MTIAVGSQNKTKVSACEVIFLRNAVRLGLQKPVHITAFDISPGVDKMPMNVDTMMNGARNRARKVFDMIPDCKFAVGAEGGLFLKYVSSEKLPITFLESWVYCFNGMKGYWGSSGAIPVPWDITVQIRETGDELAEIIDRISGKKNVRSGVGAVGILTENQIIRQDLFEHALQFAVSPFYNSFF